MIVNVRSVGICNARHHDAYNPHGKTAQCNKGLVEIELANGKMTTVHDDGSFIRYTGEQQ